jgi:coenzyme F420-dependent glucose-6-phosphate dehydrogenase
MEIGYQLSSEEHPPCTLVRNARRAEEIGFTFATISDHFHPWTDKQGQSPFVWSVIGAISSATTRLQLGTWVTCPTMRIHPAIIAQASATSAALMGGRFFLGVGTGENLNEHILGWGWPETEVRHARLEEAIAIMRLLWKGGNQSYHGKYFTVENARLYTLPDRPPPLMMAVGGPKSAQVAARLSDGLIATSPERETIQAFNKSGGRNKLKYGSVTVCWAKSERTARRTAHQIWPTSAMEDSLSWELPLPKHFEDVAKLVTEDAVAEVIVCGPDPKKHIEALGRYAEAGFDRACVHQVGPDQDGFFEFYAKHVLPAFQTGQRRLVSTRSQGKGRQRAA